MSTQSIIIIQSLIFIIEIIIILLLLKNTKVVKEYRNMYEKALSKFNGENGIKDEFINLYDRIGQLEEQNKDLIIEIDEIKAKNKKALNNVKLIKYNAYDETNNKLSFALGIVNDEKNGVMFNEIYSKHGSNIYSKEIKNGKIDERICDEEQNVLDQICLEERENNRWRK
jgi:hypothetical protein